MEAVVDTAIILALIALGEILSVATRARIPMLLVAMMGYLVLVWLGIMPKDLVKNSTFIIVGSVMSAPLLVHMGTLIPLKVMKSQYKAVLIALSGIICSAILIILVITPLYGYEDAVTGAGPLTGGLIAFIVTTEALKNLGLVSLITIPALILGLQGVLGMPLAANLLRRHALKVRDSLDASTYVAATAESVEAAPGTAKSKEKKENTSWIPKKYQSTLILLFLLFVGGAVAQWLGKMTGISYSLWGLGIGILGAFLGVYRDRMMERANAFSIGIAGLIFIVLSAMNGITFEMVIKYLPEVCLIIIVGTAGLMIGGYIGSKIFKWDPFKGIPVALTGLFGFPGDFLISQEVSRSVGRNEEEEEMIFNEIMSPMIIGGFTTVTVGSVVLASILVKTLA